MLPGLSLILPVLLIAEVSLTPLILEIRRDPIMVSDQRKRRNLMVAHNILTYVCHPQLLPWYDFLVRMVDPIPPEFADVDRPINAGHIHLDEVLTNRYHFSLHAISSSEKPLKYLHGTFKPGLARKQHVRLALPHISKRDFLVEIELLYLLTSPGPVKFIRRDNTGYAVHCDEQ